MLRVGRLSIASILTLTLIPFVVLAGEEPGDAQEIRGDMERIVTFLESDGYSEGVSWNEHVVLVYRLSLDRDPTGPEMALLCGSQRDTGITRSAVLSIALRGENLTPSWEVCRAFTARVKPSDFVADESVKERAGAFDWESLEDAVRNLMAASLAARARKSAAEDAPAARRPAQLDAPHTSYNTYFGYLHAHSELSDGEGSADEAYAYARDVGKLDFFALTDHGEYLDWWPWERKYKKLRDAAEANYIPGQFATLYGFEWSSPVFGHISIINTTDYTNAYKDAGLGDVYNWIEDRPEAFARFNHPGEYDTLFTEFLHLDLDPNVASQMVGIETWNKSTSFDEYYYKGSWTNNHSYWDVGNLKGWKLGALGAQDNHEKDWGTRNQFRTAVLAENLTREEIIDAYRKRRFYAAEDNDLLLDFRCHGYPMGSRLTGVSHSFTVEVFDRGGDTFEQIRLYRDGDLLGSKAVSGNHISGSVTIPSAGSHYYYVIVRQTDDNDNNGRNDEAISSPIWID